MDKDERDSDLKSRVLPRIPSVDVPSVDIPDTGASDTIKNPEEELVPDIGSQMNAGGSTVDKRTKRRFASAIFLANFVFLLGGIGLLTLIFEGVGQLSLWLLAIATISGIGASVIYLRTQ